MKLWIIFMLLAFWTAFGFVAYASIFADTKIDTGDLKWLSPCWIYRNYEVNLFGVILLTLFFNLMCPLLSIGFWIYKLCTVGRKR